MGVLGLNRAIFKFLYSSLFSSSTSTCNYEADTYKLDMRCVLALMTKALKLKMTQWRTHRILKLGIK